MNSQFSRVYRSFSDFERHELRKLDQVFGSVSEAVDEMLIQEVEEDTIVIHDDGILFDRLDD